MLAPALEVSQAQHPSLHYFWRVLRKARPSAGMRWLWQVAGYNVAYVGNIAFEAGESDLRELMSDCTITKVRLHTDKETGKFRGYAHIHFADEESLDK